MRLRLGAAGRRERHGGDREDKHHALEVPG
jgi:hypothetical protein